MNVTGLSLAQIKSVFSNIIVNDNVTLDKVCNLLYNLTGFGTAPTFNLLTSLTPAQVKAMATTPKVIVPKTNDQNAPFIVPFQAFFLKLDGSTDWDNNFYFRLKSAGETLAFLQSPKGDYAQKIANAGRLIPFTMQIENIAGYDKTSYNLLYNQDLVLDVNTDPGVANETNGSFLVILLYAL